VAYIKEIKDELDKALTRDNSTADPTESRSEKSPISVNKSLNETLNKIELNGTL